MIRKARFWNRTVEEKMDAGSSPAIWRSGPGAITLPGEECMQVWPAQPWHWDHPSELWPSNGLGSLSSCPNPPSRSALCRSLHLLLRLFPFTSTVGLPLKAAGTGWDGCWEDLETTHRKILHFAPTFVLEMQFSSSCPQLHLLHHFILTFPTCPGCLCQPALP